MGNHHSLMALFAWQLSFVNCCWIDCVHNLDDLTSDSFCYSQARYMMLQSGTVHDEVPFLSVVNHYLLIIVLLCSYHYS